MRNLRIRRPRLSYANVASTLALVLALSMGGAYAHGKIGSALIKDNAVKSRHIANGNVQTTDIKRNAVTAGKIKAKAVKTKHLGDHAVWALVAPDGTLVQGQGVEAIDPLGSGFYVVRFNKSVSKRALMATVYNDAAGDGQANVRYCDPAHPAWSSCGGGLLDSPKSVFVNTETSAGSNADRMFLVVALPRTPTVFTASSRVVPRSGNAEGGQR